MTDSSLEHIERQRETTMVARGVARFERKLQHAVDKGRAFDNAPFNRVADKMMLALIAPIKAMQSDLKKRFVEVLSTGGRLAGWETTVATMRPEVIAYVTVRCILSRTSEGANKAHYAAGHNKGKAKFTVAMNIGTTLMLECLWEEMRHKEGEAARADSRRNRIEDLKRTVKEVNPSTVRKWLKKLDDLKVAEWDHKERVTIGVILLDYAMTHLTDFVRFETYTASAGVGMHKWIITIELLPDVKKKLEDEIEGMAERSPWRTPMVCPPVPFTVTKPGGYLTIPGDLFKSMTYRSLNKPVPTRTEIDAINRLQNVGWKVNRGILAVANEAVEMRCEEILPVAPERDMPAMIDDNVWAAMSSDEQGRVKYDRMATHNHNNKLEARREAMRRVLFVAEDMAEFEAFYYPHNLDFRGRAYPMAQDLHPQNDDLSKSLLMFAEGKPLGPDGLKWLCHAVAAHYGNDKMSLDEQITWVETNIQSLHAVAEDPLGAGYEFLCDADKPWQFLAAVLEIEAAFNCLDEGGEFISHLPVHVDGTCNGLQHLSAMGRDPVGAKAVNLMPGPRQDIYQDVADKVAASVEDDVIINQHRYREGIVKPDMVPQHWRGHVTRKTVKRGVMTTPYGVTREGIKKQLIFDGFCDDLDGSRVANAEYLRDRMIDAIDDTIIVGKQIMSWVQNVARQLADEGKPVIWRTPTGYVCEQGYRQSAIKAISTLTGRAKINIPPSESAPLRKVKQVNAIAPNIVHSFDAAHMMLSVLKLPEGMAVTAVHDSFGTHACDVPKLGQVLRETFVEIYSEDWLASLRKDFESSLGRYEPWLEQPRLGDFDINEVLKSEYAFF